MPPKAKPAEADSITQPQFDILLAKLTALETLPSKIQSLEKLLTDSIAKTKALQEEVKAKDKLISNMKLKMNSLEQHNRKWSIRVNNIAIPEDESSDPIRVMHHTYHQALLPILNGALQSGDIDSIPAFDELLETAHILPGRDNSRPKPIIARFYSRNLRSAVFRHKKESAPKITVNNRSSFKYPIYEDLTGDTYACVKALSSDQRTGAVWTINGVVRFKLAGENTVKKVSDIYDCVETILSK